MSKRSYISRYFLLLKKLRAKPYSSYKDLEQHMNKEFRFLQVKDETIELAFSKRTLQRDVREISNLFGINIEYSKTNKGYFIAESLAENQNFQRMIEAFDMFNSLNLAQDLAPYVHTENRRPQGTDNLYGLLHAIKNKVQIIFTYQKFWEDEPTQRTAEPYALKEFKNRWYLMANNAGNIKSFALDRLTNLQFTQNKFQIPSSLNIQETYRYCFGIISPNDQQPQDVVLSFDPFQGKYIKTLPLHHTQQVLMDNDDELQIKLKLCITHDFVMELLSFGDNVTAIKPTSLINDIKNAHQKAYEQYIKIELKETLTHI